MGGCGGRGRSRRKRVIKEGRGGLGIYNAMRMLSQAGDDGIFYGVMVQ